MQVDASQASRSIKPAIEEDSLAQKVHYNGLSYEIISEKHWSSVTGVQLGVWNRVATLWQALLPEIKVHCFRRWLSDVGKYQAYLQIAERSFERNRGGKGVVTDDDIRSFNKALAVARIQDRPQVLFRLAQAYALRHLDPSQLSDCIEKKKLHLLNEEIHMMQMAAISITEVIETLFTELSQTIRNTENYLNQKRCGDSSEQEIASLEQIQKEMSTLNRIVKQAWSDENRWAGRVEREFLAARSVVDNIEVLQKLGKLPEVLKEFLRQFRFILPTYFLRASCYERIGTTLSLVYESDETLWRHRPLRWLVKGDTAEAFFIKAYRDYAIAEAMLNIIPTEVRVNLYGGVDNGDKTRSTIRTGLDRVLKLISKNPKITDAGRKIVSVYSQTRGEEPLVVAEKGMEETFGETFDVSASLSDRRVLHQKLSCMEIPQSDVERRHLVRQLLAAATYHIQRDNTLPAIELYEKLVILEPKNIGYLHQLAKLHSTVEHRKRAINTYEKLLTKDPNICDVHKELGSLYFRMGNFDQALVFLSRFERLNPKDTEVMKMLGDSYMSLGDLAEGVRYYEKAMAVDPASNYVKRVLFDACITAGDRYYRERGSTSATALKYYRRASQLFEDEFGDYLNRYLDILLREERDGEAITLYETLTQKFGSGLLRFNPDVYNRVADKYAASQGWDTAASLYSRALELESGNERAQKGLSYVYYVMGIEAWNQGNKDEALVFLHRATAAGLIPTAACHAQLAQYLMERASDNRDKGTKYDYEVAIIHLKRAIQLEPRCADYHHRLGVALTRVGRDPSKAYREAVKLEPTNRQYQADFTEIEKQ